MKTKIISIIIAIIMLIAIITVMTTTTQTTVASEEIINESNTENWTNFKIELFEGFYDPKIDSYTTDELLTLINNQKIIQNTAHNLANQARSLAWPEKGHTIMNAKNQWQNSQKAIEYYQTAYDKKIQQQANNKWNKKSQEYPAAT